MSTCGINHRIEASGKVCPSMPVASKSFELVKQLTRASD
jgi:hypothetical protein